MTLHSDRTWKFYGRKAPYYGVFGQEMYLNSNLNETSLNDFFNSGNDYVEDLFATIHSKIDPEFKAKNILDFGCGPGRMIIPFSRYAKEITGIDISQDVLDEAQKNCIENNISNVTLLKSDDNLHLLKNEKFDLVHSFITIQHINIKRGDKIFQNLLNSINENGVGILHLTYHDNYPNRKIVNFFRFRIPYLASLLRFIKSYLEKRKFLNVPQMQMHNYNLNKLFALIQKTQVKAVYTKFTNHHDYWGVLLYFQKK